jgi:hypothetical protein
MRKVQTKGATRMRERGMKLVQVWLDKQEAALIGGAAVHARKPLARWIREAAFRAAEVAAQQLIQERRNR